MDRGRAEQGRSKRVIGSNDIHRAKILIVDDNVTNQRVLSSQLVHAGYAVTTVSSGSAALDELRFKTGMEISPRLSFRSELQQAIENHYGGVVVPNSSFGTVRGGERLKFEEVEFFSTSTRQANQEAIQEVQADLRQKKTPAVRLVSELLQVAAEPRDFFRDISAVGEENDLLHQSLIVQRNIQPCFLDPGV